MLINFFKRNKIKFQEIIVPSLVGFFSLAWVGLFLSNFSYFLISKSLEKYSRKKNIFYIKWFIWLFLGFSINIVHLVNYPKSLFFEYSGFKSQNSINSALEKIKDECALKKNFPNENQTFEVPKLYGYEIKPANGSCLGDQNGKISAIKSNQRFILSWWSITSYNPYLPKSLPKVIFFDAETGVRSCVPSEEDHFCVLGR